MYKTKLKFILFTVFSILCIITMLISALFYIEYDGNKIFGVIDQSNKGIAYVLISIGFSLTVLFFCVAISIFVYYLIASIHNQKVINKIKAVKDAYQNEKKIPRDELDAGLLEIRAIIKEQKNNEKVKPIKEKEINNKPQQNIQVAKNQ